MFIYQQRNENLLQFEIETAFTNKATCFDRSSNSIFESSCPPHRERCKKPVFFLLVCRESSILSIPTYPHINKNNNKILWGACFSILHLNFTYDEYFKKVIKSPERALIRKAMKNGFYVQRIEYDDYLEQIKAINTSKAMRGGHEMDKDYINPKKRDVLIKPINPHIYTYGCFNPEGTLVAYYMFERFTNFYHTVKGIGHSEYLNMGIMNYLFAYSVSDLAKRQPDMLLVYGGMGTDGLSRFKKNVGCIGSSIIYSGKKESFRVLKHFIKRYHLHNDTALNYVTDYIY